MSKNNSFNFHAFVSELYEATELDAAFSIFQNASCKLGYDGVLYTYIPRVLLDTKFHVQPVYKVSEKFSSEVIAHYTNAHFEKIDPIFETIKDGATSPLFWRSQTTENYANSDHCSHNVLNTEKECGINNGVTLPLLSGVAGISWASFIILENNGFGRLLDEQLDSLYLCAKLFHEMVQNNAKFKREFVTSFLDTLNNTEIRLLIGLAKGHSQAELASELNRSEGYLEQVIIKLRRKFSGVGPYDAPLINRNQLLYYVGLLELMQ